MACHHGWWYLQHANVLFEIHVCFSTHWGWVTHICVDNLTIIGSDNGLSPCGRQAIIWTNAGILLIRTLATNFSEILSEIHAFSFKKMNLKMSSAKWRPFGLGLNVLKAFDSNGLPPLVHTLLVAPVYLRVSSYNLCISYYNMKQNMINYDTLTRSSMFYYTCPFSYYFSKNKIDMQLKDIHVYKLAPWLFVFIPLLSIWASFAMIPKSLHNAFFDTAQDGVICTPQ